MVQYPDIVKHSGIPNAEVPKLHNMVQYQDMYQRHPLHFFHNILTHYGKMIVTISSNRCADK